MRHILLPKLLEKSGGISKKVSNSQGSPVHTFMKHQRFMALYCPRLLFLDGMSYTSPMSLDNFVKSMGVTNVAKSTFCYEYIQSPVQLKEEQWPPIEKWNSWLRHEKISEDQYQKLQQLWNERGYSTLKDALREYNILDIISNKILIRIII